MYKSICICTIHDCPVQSDDQYFAIQESMHCSGVAQTIIYCFLLNLVAEMLSGWEAISHYMQ